MKKALIIAALFAAATAVPATAEEIVIVDEAAVDAQCFILPLLPDCAAQWNAYWLDKGYHVTTPIAWWTCKPADEGAGHLLACETN
jgi:hypothetical protein